MTASKLSTYLCIYLLRKLLLKHFFNCFQEDQKTLKSKMREKVRPKMGKIDIDYQKLHDAFFRFQTKPKMTVHGDLYYEVNNFFNGLLILYFINHF